VWCFLFCLLSECKNVDVFCSTNESVDRDDKILRCYCRHLSVTFAASRLLVQSHCSHSVWHSPTGDTGAAVARQQSIALSSCSRESMLLELCYGMILCAQWHKRLSDRNVAISLFGYVKVPLLLLVFYLENFCSGCRRNPNDDSLEWLKHDFCSGLTNFCVKALKPGILGCECRRFGMFTSTNELRISSKIEWHSY